MKHKGIEYTLKAVRDVDGELAVQYYILGRWMGTAANRSAAIQLVERKIDRDLLSFQGLTRIPMRRIRKKKSNRGNSWVPLDKVSTLL